MALTRGHLLGGRLRYTQPASGFRSGIEPVLLAAAIPVRSGERVVEAGCGAGAALLCLAARAPGIVGLGVERDPELALIAIGNAQANDFRTLRFVTADIRTVELEGSFDHACANPPYHDAKGTRSPNDRRELAKRSSPELLSVWTQALTRALRPRGTLTFILPAALLPACLEAMEAAGTRPTAALPLWPKAGRACKLLLVRGVKGGRSPFRLLPGLVLHQPEGGYTAEADAIMRAGGIIDLA
jgi:tRNA1(Val) A37 N6-methylase TrmN6